MRRSVIQSAPVRPIPHLANRLGRVRAESPSGLEATSIRGSMVASTLLASFVVAAFAVEARAEASVSDPIFYGGPEIAIYGHTGKGNSTTTDVTGPRVDDAFLDPGDYQTDEILPAERSREEVLAALVGGTFGFLTPGLDVSGRPRFFIDLNVSEPLGTEVQFARSGNPGQPAFPRGSGAGSQVNERAIIGAGTVISAQLQGPQVHAGLGVSFEIPLDDEQLIRIKPAAVYSRTVLDIEAQTIRGVRLNDDFGSNQTLEDDYRIINLRDQRTEVYHAAGPSLEVEYVPNLEWGPFTVSLYGRGHAAHIFNTLATKMQQCNTAGGQPDECASWKYTQDEWTYRATFGVHLNWVPRPLW